MIAFAGPVVYCNLWSQEARVGSTSRYRFGVFEFDAQTPELRKAGRLVRLRPQGLKLLTLLMSRPREVIDREEIAKWLWDADVFVDVEQGVNHTIKQVRAALGDDAESPRYVETIPRRGYRFIAPVEVVAEPNDVPVPTRSVTHARARRTHVAGPGCAAESDRLGATPSRPDHPHCMRVAWEPGCRVIGEDSHFRRCQPTVDRSHAV